MLDDVPLSSQIEVNRTGVGLAWSYYYGYFDIILPGMFIFLRSLTTYHIYLACEQRSLIANLILYQYYIHS